MQLPTGYTFFIHNCLILALTPGPAQVEDYLCLHMFKTPEDLSTSLKAFYSRQLRRQVRNNPHSQTP